MWLLIHVSMETPESNESWPIVGPTSGRQYRRWVNVCEILYYCALSFIISRTVCTEIVGCYEKSSQVLLRFLLVYEEMVFIPPPWSMIPTVTRTQVRSLYARWTHFSSKVIWTLGSSPLDISMGHSGDYSNALIKVLTVHEMLLK